MAFEPYIRVLGTPGISADGDIVEDEKNHNFDQPFCNVTGRENYVANEENMNRNRK